MKIIEFYRCERGNQNGHKLDDIVTNWTDGWLEMDHDYIQWVFPSNEVSAMNGEAPTLTREEASIFENDLELQDKVKRSFVRFLRFLQFELEEHDEQIIIKPIQECPRWLTQFNHTMLRVTRILKSLRLTGNTKYANAFYDALRPYKSRVSENTWSFWYNAVFEPLW